MLRATDQRAHALPLLTVVFNNQQWEAVKFGALGVHPDGVARQRGRFPLSELTPSPRFEEMARTVDGYGERVDNPGELPAALKRGLAAQCRDILIGMGFTLDERGVRQALSP